MERGISKQILIIEWADCCKQGSETLHEDDCMDLGLMNLISAGVLINENSDSITLGNDYCAEYGNYRDVVTYPTSGILRIIRLRIHSNGKLDTWDDKQWHKQTISHKNKG